MRIELRMTAPVVLRADSLLPAGTPLRRACASVLPAGVALVDGARR